jgi:hypothetical protein
MSSNRTGAVAKGVAQQNLRSPIPGCHEPCHRKKAASVCHHRARRIFQIAGCDGEIHNTSSQAIPVDDPASAKVHVTFFSTKAATNLTTETLTFEELAECVRNTARREKNKLPWLKLAVFGKTRTEAGCLRNDDNVIAVTGGELDYDLEMITCDAAVAAVRELGIHALVYTSASHSLATPRWRVLIPFSKSYPPAMRYQFVARLNGALKAKLNVTEIARSESFALSQSFYFGCVNSSPKPDHKAQVIGGDFIDLRDDLSIHEANGGPATEKKNAGHDINAASTTSDDRARGFENILAEIGDGDGLNGFNDPLTRAAASYVALHNGNPFDKLKLKTLLRDAINKAPKKPTRNTADIERYLGDKYLDDAISSAERKFVERRPITRDDFVAVNVERELSLYSNPRDVARQVSQCLSASNPADQARRFAGA